jgi:hypothetical protein
VVDQAVETYIIVPEVGMSFESKEEAYDMY